MSVESNAQEFSAAIEKFVEQMPQIADIVIRKSAMDIVAETAREWPVDTGRSRAAWIAAVSDPPTANYAGNREKNIPGGVVVADSLKTKSESGNFSITVTNPVNYAPFIEYGTVNVAPRGHLQRAIRIVRTDAGELLAELIQNEWDGAR